MSGFIDIHHHILYGIDDGPKTFDEMAAMLKAAAKDGIEYIIATPHITPGFNLLDEGTIQSRISDARDFCATNHINLKIILGAEILVTPLLANALLDKNVPTIEGTEYVLVEFLPNVRFADMTRELRQLIRGGYIVILAHMERYRCLRHNYSRIMRLKEQYGIMLQLNCSTLVQSKGYFWTRYIKKLFARRLIDFIATDAHDVTHRRSRMKDTYDCLKNEYGEEYANKLTRGGLDILGILK